LILIHLVRWVNSIVQYLCNMEPWYASFFNPLTGDHHIRGNPRSTPCWNMAMHFCHTYVCQTCQPVRFWRIFPILGLNFALSTTVDDLRPKNTFFHPILFLFFLKFMKMIPWIVLFAPKFKIVSPFLLIIAHVGEKKFEKRSLFMHFQKFYAKI
jgi:hypothetical protein